MLVPHVHPQVHACTQLCAHVRLCVCIYVCVCVCADAIPHVFKNVNKVKINTNVKHPSRNNKL